MHPLANARRRGSGLVWDLEHELICFDPSDVTERHVPSAHNLFYHVTRGRKPVKLVWGLMDTAMKGIGDASLVFCALVVLGEGEANLSEVDRLLVNLERRDCPMVGVSAALPGHSDHTDTARFSSLVRLDPERVIGDRFKEMENLKKVIDGVVDAEPQGVFSIAVSGVVRTYRRLVRMG